ncbi:MFS transporter [Dongshaea marina]|uniref:MFS transporter n=1 Tax=Dongshaea marina TaxID=2047966 RepID=UPI00131EF0B0|nr:MFS transporter [Dongshaea marina]
MLSIIIQDYGWQNALYYIALVGFILAAVILLLFRERRPALPQISETPSSGHGVLLWSVMQSPGVWVLALYAGIMVGVVVIGFSELYNVIFTQKILGLGQEQAASITILTFIGIAVGGPLHGAISSLFRKNTSWMRISAVITLLLFATVPLFIVTGVKSVWLVRVLYFSLGFFVSSMLLSFDVVRNIVPSSLHGTAFALINLTISLIGFAFQIILGHLESALQFMDSPVHPLRSYTLSLLLIALPLLIAVLLVIFKVKPNNTEPLLDPN